MDGLRRWRALSGLFVLLMLTSRAVLALSAAPRPAERHRLYTSPRASSRLRVAGENTTATNARGAKPAAATVK